MGSERESVSRRIHRRDIHSPVILLICFLSQGGGKTAMRFSCVQNQCEGTNSLEINPQLREELRSLGLHELVDIYAHLPAVALLEHALHRREGMLAENGALVVETGKFTGRSPKDKYFVEEPGSRDKIWWGVVNHRLTEDSFDRLHQRMSAYLREKDVFVQDLFGGADARCRLPVRIVTEKAWHSLFAHQLLIRPEHDFVGI